MHHTTLKGSSHRFQATAARPVAYGVVALTALALVLGCGTDDEAPPTTEQMENQPSTEVTPMPGGSGGNGTNEGNPGGIGLVGGGTPVVGTSEDSGADCAIGLLPSAGELQPLQTLPDPFLALNGERLTSKAQWRCRRAEIKKLAETFIYGQKPPKPESVGGTVSATGITVDVQNQGLSASFSATITLPEGATGPVPAIIGYGGSSFQATILEEGVAFINFNVTAVGNEQTRNPKVGAFYTVNPDRADTGMLVAWAWGVSRMIDLIEASGSDIINPKAIGVHGCSRSGKGAFIAGAFDERVALTLPFESGMAGVPAFRMIVPEGGEVLRNAYEYRPWAGDTFQQFLVLGAPQTDMAALAAQNVASGELQFKLPLDTHEVIGMVAPRGLFVMGNPFIANLAPRAENVTVLAGAEIYSALGAQENLSYVSNIADGTHCSFRPEFVPPLQQNIRKFLKNDTSATTGMLDVHANIAGELGPNVAWTTPTLQ
jgi:hypothetical protein